MSGWRLENRFSRAAGIYSVSEIGAQFQITYFSFYAVRCVYTSDGLWQVKQAIDRTVLIVPFTYETISRAFE